MPTTILDNETYPEALQRRYAEEIKAEKQAEIISMANEACQPHQILNTDLEFLIRFAALVAAHEREVCAKVCDVLVSYSERQRDDPTIGKYVEGFGDGSISCAAAIRARGEKNEWTL